MFEFPCRPVAEARQLPVSSCSHTAYSVSSFQSHGLPCPCRREAVTARLKGRNPSKSFSGFTFINCCKRLAIGTLEFRRAGVEISDGYSLYGTVRREGCSRPVGNILPNRLGIPFPTLGNSIPDGRWVSVCVGSVILSCPCCPPDCCRSDSSACLIRSGRRRSWCRSGSLPGRRVSPVRRPGTSVRRPLYRR